MKIKMKRQKGAAVVEFAIILPLLLVLLFGIIEFGLLMYNKHIITNASREGARYGIVMKSLHGTETVPRRHNAAEIQDVVLSFINSNPSKKRLVTFGADILEKNDNDIQVSVCKNFVKTPCLVEGDWKTIAAASPDFGDRLRVRVNYRYDFLLMPSFISKLAKFSTINAETVMNYE